MGAPNAAVYHASLYGNRAHKYEKLSRTDRHTTDWSEITLNAPHYLFVPQDELTRGEYEAG